MNYHGAQPPAAGRYIRQDPLMFTRCSSIIPEVATSKLKACDCSERLAHLAKGLRLTADYRPLIAQRAATAVSITTSVAVFCLVVANSDWLALS